MPTVSYPVALDLVIASAPKLDFRSMGKTSLLKFHPWRLA
jgi:hypothetical protein